MVLRILFSLFCVFYVGALWGQQTIIWENGDRLNCIVKSYNKDSIEFKLDTNAEIQVISTENVKLIKFDHYQSSKRKIVEYVSKERQTYSKKNKQRIKTYNLPEKNKYRIGVQKQLSANFGFVQEQEGGVSIAPNLKFSIWKLGRQKLNVGGAIAFSNYSPGEKKFFLTPSLGLYYVPSKSAGSNFLFEVGYGYTSARMANFLDKDFKVNVLRSTGGLYSGLWIEKQLFGLDKNVVNFTGGLTYQRGSFELELLDDIFVFKSQEIDLIRIWMGVGVRF
jgi:hypothetical protein